MLYVSDIPVRTHVVVRRSCTTSIGRMIREQYNTTLAAVQHIGKPYYYSDYIRVFTIRTHVWFNNNSSNVYDITRPYCAANDRKRNTDFVQIFPRCTKGAALWGIRGTGRPSGKCFYLLSTLKYICYPHSSTTYDIDIDEIHRRRHPKRQTCYRANFSQ